MGSFLLMIELCAPLAAMSGIRLATPVRWLQQRASVSALMFFAAMTIGSGGSWQAL